MSDFKAKMHQIRLPLGLRPRSQLEDLTALPSPLAVFKPTLLVCIKTASSYDHEIFTDGQPQDFILGEIRFIQKF